MVNLPTFRQIERQSKQVKGPNFNALHDLFDKVAEATEGFSDLLAERVAALGGTAEGRLQAVSGQSALPVYPGEIFSGREHVDALSTSLAAFGRAVREAIDEAAQFGDADTADVFTEISRETDKQLWLVEAHLHYNPADHKLDEHARCHSAPGRFVQFGGGLPVLPAS